MNEYEKLQQRSAALGKVAGIMSAGCWIVVLIPIMLVACFFVYSAFAH